jgi:hypothetical protein
MTPMSLYLNLVLSRTVCLGIGIGKYKYIACTVHMWLSVTDSPRSTSVDSYLSDQVDSHLWV